MKLRQIAIAVAIAFSPAAFAADDLAQTQVPPQSKAGQHAQSQPADVVKQVQQSLKQQGIDVGTANGQWSTATQEGVKKFQQQRGMVATGHLDEYTLKALGVQVPSSSAGGSQAPKASQDPMGSQKD
jgi:peptidoglycan hydrolase-like protein with peptidoglycan-binding domain